MIQAKTLCLIKSPITLPAIKPSQAGTMSVIRSILVFCVCFAFLDTSFSLYLGRPLGRGRGRGEKWRLQGSAEGEGDGLRQWEDDRLDAIIATDEYIEDMENKIRDLEEIVAEVIEELKDDEDSMDL